MPRFLFPWFEYGSVSDPVLPPPPPPPQWGAVAVASQNWVGDHGPTITPRMERIHGQAPRVVSEQVEFAHRIKSEFAFIVANGNQIYLRSTLTQTR